jgi:hypothetical protein
MSIKGDVRHHADQVAKQKPMKRTTGQELQGISAELAAVKAELEAEVATAEAESEGQANSW